MSTPRLCPQCGTELPANVPASQCPKCLLNVGLGSQSDAGNGTQPAPPPPPPPPSPAELAPHFPHLEILELIGQGGMGVVYKARHPRLDRLVALKILPADPHRDAAFAERFTREARALARLNHPHIVAVYDFGETAGIYYLLMEFVDGLNLRQLEQAGDFTPAAALKIVPAICEALQYAHDQGIVHRDIKPENILVDQQGRVKIADFGLAKLLGQAAAPLNLTQAQQVMGTVNYMAPEQREKPLEVDHRADIYSLGVVFYEMLTGELPLGRFAPPSQKVQVDVRLDEVVLRSLEKERDRRYQHASDVKTDVETIARTPRPSSPDAPASTGLAEWQLALRAVKGPALGLLVTGILNWVLVPVYLLVGMYFLSHQGHDGQVWPFATALLAVLAASTFLIFAGLKMKRLEAYGVAVAGGVLAMLVSPGNLIGLPLGVWALVVLSQSDIRAAFRRQPRPASAEFLPPAANLAAPPADRSRRWFFTTATVLLIGVGLVVALVMGAIVVALALPALHRAKEHARRVAASANATVLKTFTPADTPIAADLVATNGGWYLHGTNAQTLRLFEVAEPGVEQGVLVYQARLKTHQLQGRAYLEMWCRFPGKGEFFSRGLDHVAMGTTDWAKYQTRFFLQRGEQPDLVKLNLVVEGTGNVWLTEVELARAPLPENLRPRK